MILLCISLTPACSACPGETITPLLLASGAANITGESWGAPGLDLTARTAHEQVHPCAHGHPNSTSDDGFGYRDYQLRSNSPSGRAQVNNRPALQDSVPPFEAEPDGATCSSLWVCPSRHSSDRARTRERASQVFSTTEHGGTFTLLPLRRLCCRMRSNAFLVDICDALDWTLSSRIFQLGSLTLANKPSILAITRAFRKSPPRRRTGVSFSGVRPRATLRVRWALPELTLASCRS